MTSSEDHVELSIELESKLFARLVEEWEQINYTYFKDVLRTPVLRLADTHERLGQWHGELRSLELSRAFVLSRPWVEVLEVLKHEMAHQFVDECLMVDETAHGPTFRRVCERMGIDASATGVLSRSQDEDDPAYRTLDRVRKLLALAQSPNQHEAEVAATAARRLMVKYNIEAEQAAADITERRRYGFRHLGRPTGRIFEPDRWLGSILASYFFVKVVWVSVYRPLEGKRGTVLEITGLEANLVMAEHVHAFLSASAARLWSEFKRSTKLRSNRDRITFLAGVMRGFDAKLAAQSEQFQEEGLVWVPGAELRVYFHRRHPRLQSVRRGGGRKNMEVYDQGQRAGREIVLSKPVETGPSGRAPLALAGGKGGPR